MNTVMELEIGPGPDPGSYVVHVLRSVGGGEPSQTITIDLDGLVDRRPLLEATVLSSSVSARRVMSATEAVVQDVGGACSTRRSAATIRSAYRTSMAVASERGLGVQIALRLTAPGLAALPWEALFDAEAGVYLCRKEPLVRHVPAPSLAARAVDRAADAGAGHDLLTARAAGARRGRREGAARGGPAAAPRLGARRARVARRRDAGTPCTPGSSRRSGTCCISSGHGTYDVETDEGVLVFVGRDGRADYVTASSLADLLDEAEPTPRLVVLNSCQSGAGGTTDLFSGTAAALAHSGIRAVAAMQFSISDTAAIEFARGFYTALAHGRGIDEAVRSGRIGILGLGRGTLEWVTPVPAAMEREEREREREREPPWRASRSQLPGRRRLVRSSCHRRMPRRPARRPRGRRTAPQPTAPAMPVRPTTVTPPTVPRTPPIPPPPLPTTPSLATPLSSPSLATAPTIVEATIVEATSAAPTVPIPGSPRHPATPASPPLPPPPVSRPSAVPPSPQPTPGWKPWLVVALIAILAIAAAVTLFVLRPWDGPIGGGGTTDQVVGPEPDATVDVQGTEPQWVSMACCAERGDTFELTATGGI